MKRYHEREQQRPEAAMQRFPRTLLASSDDRLRVAEALQSHYVAGRLSSDELEDRLSEAHAARTLADLDAALVDLPPVAEPSRAPSWGAHGVGYGGHSGHAPQKGFRAHSISYFGVIALLVAIWALTTPGGYFWPVWPMLGWGIGLVSHALAVRFAPHGDSGRARQAAGLSGRCV